MKNFEYDGDKYLLPLKVDTTKSNIAWTFIGAVFIFVTLPFSFLSVIAVETCINKGGDLFGISLAITTALVALSSLIIILPRHLIIDVEKIQLKCLIYKKEIYWADLTSFSVNASDVAFSARPVWNKDKNLVMHKANQTMPGIRVGIKKIELIFCKKNSKMGTFKFFIPIDSNINFDILIKTIYYAYRKRK